MHYWSSAFRGPFWELFICYTTRAQRELLAGLATRPDRSSLSCSTASRVVDTIQKVSMMDSPQAEASQPGLRERIEDLEKEKADLLRELKAIQAGRGARDKAAVGGSKHR